MKIYIKRLFKKKTIQKMYKNKVVFLIMILLSTLFLGIGYAQISDIELKVSGSATANISENIVITSVVYDSNTNADPTKSTINDSVLTLMDSQIVLENDLLSTITYKVRIKNNCDIAAIFNDAVFLQPMGYDNPDIEFVLNGINHGDIISPGQKKEFTITFKYKDSLSSVSNTTLNSLINYRFNLEDKVARIGNVYYNTLQEAINAAQADTITYIDLLCDTSETLTIPSDKYIEVALRNNTISNVGNTPIIENNGHLTFRNGMIKSDAVGNGAINNRVNATLLLDSVIVDVTGGKQALYNEKGTATITGNSYLRSTSDQRGAVQSTAGGTLNIESGTIISTRHNAVVNAGIMTIGILDGTANNATPQMTGRYYGITSETYYNFYDGVAKGRTYGLNNTGRANGIEQGYEIVTSEEIIDGNVYITNFPAIAVTVTFEPVSIDATVDEPSRKVAIGYRVGEFPEAIRSGYELVGWFTAPNGGDEVSPDTIINNDITFYAHWKLEPQVARIGDTEYSSIQAAINDVQANTQTTILLQKNTQENNITIPNNKSIILDLNGNTISNSSVNATIENSGDLVVQNGTLSSSSDKTAAINNNTGTLTVSANVTATGSRQAIYIYGGTVYITGNPTITSNSTGTAFNSTLGRSTVQCTPSGTLIITGGTIIGNVQQAVANEGTLIIGSKDGNVNNSNPIIRGETYGVQSLGTFSFYDGTIMGITDAISGTISDTETTLVDSTTTISGKSYKTTNNS